MARAQRDNNFLVCGQNVDHFSQLLCASKRRSRVSGQGGGQSLSEAETILAFVRLMEVINLSIF